ncbi:Gfo/Idh/MocA family oxidoreductase [Catenovulum sp. SM1970]|uniref:Gfo/Idh/MocA family protein n=1 Tax=Marinifaba aquimaris TaxID=2741323 RepID=UPI001572350B|nr:Gfo/Idh/MocA family oxidoreductase [Marinifaba aquimaris]NTS78791.1 Gfo/Idh/MocA family oxidoreductase [Marinifaba aquimaris]
MKVALVGTNWGRIHINIFRRLGMDINLLIGKNLEKSQQIAKQEGIAKASNSLEDLSSVDLIILATPASTHLDIIKAFPDKAIWCEKPVSLAHIDESELDYQQLSRCYVNYAFPHLNSVKLATNIIREGRLGRVQSVMIKCGFNLPGDKSFSEWYSDIIIHPFSYVHHLFGKFELQMAYQMPEHNHISSVFTTKNIQMDMSFYRSHEAGMLFDITFIGEKSDLHLKGGYKPYSHWHFDPVKVDSVPQNAGEHSKDEDIWLQANAEAARLFLHTINGEITTNEAKASGLYNLKRAINMEKALLDALKAI